MTVDMKPGSELPTRIYAGFWIRLAASIIDDLILVAASLGMTYLALYLLYVVLHPAPTFGEAFTGGFIQTVNFAAMNFLSIPYYITFHWKYGATPGKRVLKIRVIRDIDDGSLSLGRSTTRYFSQILSMITFGAGYLMVAFSHKKQALHDRIAGTVSVMVRDSQ